MGRTHLPLRFRMNSRHVFRSTVFSADCETLTVEEDFRPVTPGHAHMHPSLAAFGAAGSLPPWSDVALPPDSPRSLPCPSQRPADSTAIATTTNDTDTVRVEPAHLPLPTASGAQTSTTSTTSFSICPDATPAQCSTTTTSTAPPVPAVTLACAVHGDRPRCVRLHPRDHIAQALWSILSEPGRVLPEVSSWTLAACPRSFPDCRTGRLILTTISTLDPFTCHAWLDVRGPSPRLFAAELARGTSTASLIATFAPSLDPCYVFLDGALAGTHPALRDGCVLTFCDDRHLCSTEPLASLFDCYPSLRTLQFPFKVPFCILALQEARRVAAFGAVPIQVSVFEREFLFRLAADAELRLGAIGTSCHYATVAICSPSWGVCFTATENRVSPSASSLRAFVQDVWPEHSSDRILDTGEFFGDATFYIVTRVARPLVMWIRADPSHHDVLWLPPEVKPEDGIPCPRNFYVHVFRHAGAWGLYDFRAGLFDGVYSAYSPSAAAAALGNADLPSDDLGSAEPMEGTAALPSGTAPHAEHEMASDRGLFSSTESSASGRDEHLNLLQLHATLGRASDRSLNAPSGACPSKTASTDTLAPTALARPTIRTDTTIPVMVKAYPLSL